MERFIVDIQEEATSGSGVKQENQVQEVEQRAPKRAAPRIKRPSLRRGLGAKRRRVRRFVPPKAEPKKPTPPPPQPESPSSMAIDVVQKSPVLGSDHDILTSLGIGCGVLQPAAQQAIQKRSPGVKQPPTPSSATTGRSDNDILALLGLGSRAPTQSKPRITARSPTISAPSASVTLQEPSQPKKSKKIVRKRLHSAAPARARLPRYDELQYLPPAGSPLPDLRRKIKIPNTFDSVAEYRRVWTTAVYEEMQLLLWTHARRFQAAATGLGSSTGASRQVIFRRKKFGYYDRSRVQFMRTGGAQDKANRYRRKHSLEPRRERLYIKILADREPYARYSKGDLWVLSTDHSLFRPKGGEKSVFLVQSLFHGPSKNGMIEVKPVGRRGAVPRGHSIQVFALRGPNASTHIDMVENLERMTRKTTPVLPRLLGRKGDGNGSRKNKLSRTSSGALATLRNKISPKWLSSEATREGQRAGLNDDQLLVMKMCAGWLGSGDASRDDEICDGNVTLVHGPFGSGKSSLIVNVILFLCRVLAEKDPDVSVRVLVCSLTNTAVDRILCGLLDRNFNNFARVGCVRKMAKRVLPHAFPYSDDARSGAEPMVQQLQGMFREPSLAHGDRKCVKEAIAEVESERRTRADLEKCRVVGATCNATTFPILSGVGFSIVCLDECSQMVEPMSALSLTFGCEALLACGDPNQLPPVLEGARQGGKDTLARGLFSRLSRCKRPVLLRTQYRCHPDIADIANTLFYNGELVDGVTAEQRSAVLGGVPPYAVCNQRTGRESQAAGGSYTNQKEAEAVACIVVRPIYYLLFFYYSFARGVV